MLMTQFQRVDDDDDNDEDSYDSDAALFEQDEESEVANSILPRPEIMIQK